jgi:hypothetical protein
MMQIRNLLLFIILALWNGTPFHLWPYAWREVQAEHLAQVRKTVWELKKQGHVREDREGRLWSKK